MTITIGIVVFVILFFGSYFYTNITYDTKLIKKLYKAGFMEKQVTLADGTVLNYGEGPDNGKQALLLIHGQAVTWEDYAKVLPALAEHFHVYAVDCHGHGESSMNPEKYKAQLMGEDFKWFIEHVIQESVIVSGHSSGGLLTAWLAANAPEHMKGIIIEDAPFFSTKPGRRETTYVWIDGFNMYHEFTQQNEENDYFAYYLKRSYWKNVFGEKLWNRFAKDALFYKRKHAHKPAKVWYLPPAINRIWETITYPYDRCFGETFYTYSWFDGFDEEETLSQIDCPTVFIKASTKYDKNGTMLAALSEEDTECVIELIGGSKRMNIKSGHDVHYDHPKAFIKIVLDFAKEL